MNGFQKLIFASSTTAIVVLSGPVHAQAADDPIIFGLVADTTGPAAPYATLSRHGFLAAVEYVNSNGGILGRPIEVIEENDESDPTRSPAIARRLIEAGADVLFFSSGGAAVIQTKPVVQEAQILSFAQTTITGAIASPPENDFFFSLANSVGDVVTVLCDSWREIGIEDLAVLGDASPTIDLFLQGLLPPIEGCTSLVAVERAPNDVSDMTAQALRLRASNPDAVLVVSNGGPFDPVAFQAIGQMMPDAVPFSTFTIGTNPENWRLASPGALEGVVFTSAITLDNPNTRMIVDALSPSADEVYDITPFEAWAWDAVLLAQAAIELAGGVDDRVALRDAMYRIEDYQAHFGQNGFTLSFTPDRHIGADGLCGIVMNIFGSENRPLDEPWNGYQPACN